MAPFRKVLDISEDNKDLFLDGLEWRYKISKNPMCAWNAILRLEKTGRSDYPKWIRQYLVQCAKNLKTCDPTQKGTNGIVNAFNLKGNHLYEEDVDKLILIMRLMDEKTGNGLSLLESSQQVENELDQSGFVPGEHGYWGESKIEKFYRDQDKIRRNI